MLIPGTHLQDRYEVIELISQGGMGAVYRARDRRLRRMVALKETLVTDRTLRAALEREARLLANLRHVALPQVSDHFVEGTGQFLVMDFIEGDDLEQLRARPGSWLKRPEALPGVLRWGDQLLDVLEYLHGQPVPIIHGDIKPRNLKHNPQGTIVLLDFGLSKGGMSLSQPLEGDVQSTVVPRDGGVRGYTPFYAPLEQVRGIDLDPRSDLYALGATLYHLLTGVRPPDVMSRVMAYLDGHPDPLQPAKHLLAHLPDRVTEVLERAMALRIGDRYPSAAAMRAELQGGIPAPTRAQRQNGARPLLPGPVISAPHRADPLHTIALDSPTRTLAFAPNGSLLAVGCEDASVALLRRNKVVRVLSGHTGSIRSLSFSPDGSTLVTGSEDQTVRLWDVDRGTEREILQVGRTSVESALVSPDGRLVAAGGWGTSILLWQIDADGARPLEPLPTIFLHSLTFSPDSRTLAVGCFDGSVARWSLPDGTPRATLQGHHASVLSVAFSPNGEYLAASGGSGVVLWRVRTDRPLTMAQRHTSSVRSIAFSPNSAMLATASEDRSVRLWRADNAMPLPSIFEHPSGVVAVCFSPDGQLIVSSAHDGMLRLWRTPPLV